MKHTNATRRRRGGLARPVGALLLAASMALAACGEDGNGDGAAEGDDGGDTEDSEAAAADWEPEETITMVVPFAAGGGSDVLGRAVAAGLEEVRDGVSVAVENRTGGAGAVGYGYFLENTGDPHYLLPAEVTRSILPQTQEVPFDWDTWTSVGQFFEDVGYFVVSSDSPWEDIESFIEEAEERTEQGQPMRVGVPAAGGVDEVLALGLADEAGVEFEIVAYDGTGETNPALQGGDIEATVGNPSDTRQEIEAELFRPLLGFAEERLDDPIFEDVPVAPELGYDLTSTKYRGVILPPDVPEEAVAWYTEALQEWTETESYAQYMEDAALAENQQWGSDWDAFIEEWNAQVFPRLEGVEGE
jgi:putative tricarboxylic transport membrane protein